ncbi:MAG TPA: alginate lyase family protein, partial [Anaerolineaceae bacterium]|nr:alginate lyase family protein [Anaerolineaceae bacterium]
MGTQKFVKINRKISSLQSLYEHFGLRWIIFRIGYAIRMKTGILKEHIPAYQWQDRPLQDWIKHNLPYDVEGYANWRKENQVAYLYPQAPVIPKKFKWNREQVIKEADQYLAGIIRYFSKTDFQIGFPPDWHLDPLQNIYLPSIKHWTQIPDGGKFDIKYVWEASRFSHIFSLVRAYAHKQDDHYVSAFWTGIEDWIENNPPNMGANWKDGQEAALRLLAISFGYHAFQFHSETTVERVSKLTILVGALAERICKNIDYAIFTRSNHTISEGFGLWLTGTLFPELKNAEKYQKDGRRILEKEAAKQIYPDGSYSMHSLNYHRFVLHLYIFALRIAELNKITFSDCIHQAIERSVEYLYHLIDLKTGYMPQYGSNDGALVLPLNSCDFGDYRPLLQAGYYLLHKKRLFPPGPWDEDLFWLFGAEALTTTHISKTQLMDHVFLDAGISKLSGDDSHLFIRCGHLRDRPSHADQLHVDLWWQNKNIAVDAGTYLYGGDGHWQNGLAKTNVHNTICIDQEDQMQQFSRFIWVNWSQGTVFTHHEDLKFKYWQGQHNGYCRLKDPVLHKRSVILLNGKGWLIVDHVYGNSNHNITLNWLLDNNFSKVDGEENNFQF